MVIKNIENWQSKEKIIKNIDYVQKLKKNIEKYWDR